MLLVLVVLSCVPWTYGSNELCDQQPEMVFGSVSLCNLRSPNRKDVIREIFQDDIDDQPEVSLVCLGCLELK